MALLLNMTSTVVQRIALLPPYALNDPVALAAAAEPSLALACDSSTADDVVHAVCRGWCQVALRGCCSASRDDARLSQGQEERAAVALVIALPRVGLDPPDAQVVSKILGCNDDDDDRQDHKPNNAVDFDALATASFLRRNAPVGAVCPGALGALVDFVFGHAVAALPPSSALDGATVNRAVSALSTCCAVATNDAPGRLLVSTLSSWIVAACAADLRRDTTAGACVRAALVSSFSRHYGTARSAVDAHFNAAAARSLRLEVLSASMVALTTNAGTALAGRTSVVECIAHQVVDDGSTTTGLGTSAEEWFEPLAGDVELLLRAGRAADLELRSSNSAAPSAVGCRDVDVVTSLGVPSCDAPAFSSAFADATCRINLRAVSTASTASKNASPKLPATAGWAGRVLGPLMRHSVDSCRKELRWALDASAAAAAPTVLIANSHAWPQRLAKSCIHSDAVSSLSTPTTASLRKFLSARLPISADSDEPTDDVASLSAALAKLAIGTRLPPSATRSAHESHLTRDGDGDSDSPSRGAPRTYTWLPAWTTTLVAVDAGGTFPASLLEVAVLMAVARLQKVSAAGGSSVPVPAAALVRCAASSWDQACAKVESMFGGGTATTGHTGQHLSAATAPSRAKAAAALGLEEEEDKSQPTASAAPPASSNTPSTLTCSWIAAALASLVVRGIVSPVEGGADMPQVTVDWTALGRPSDNTGETPLGWAAVHALRCPLDVAPGGGRRRVGASSGAADAKAAAARSEAAMVRALKQQASDTWASALALASSCGVPADAAERVLATLADRGFCEKHPTSREWRYVA